MYDDLWIKVFETLGWEEDLNNLRKVNKSFNKLIKFKHLSGLKIKEKNKYLLEYNLKNITIIDAVNKNEMDINKLKSNELIAYNGNNYCNVL